MQFSYQEAKSAAIVGAGHGIGLALTSEVLTSTNCAHVFASYRNAELAKPLMLLQKRYPERLHIFHLNPVEEADIIQLATTVAKYTKSLDLLINCVGLLHDSDLQPEKSLREISGENLLKYFQVNSIVTPLLAKHFLNFFRHKSPSCFATVSAKVGSITDNHMGGWYGYRASKAALNMFLKNISLEFARKSCHTLVLALHPGTTVTQLSEPFIKATKLKLHSPEETARNMLSVIDQKSLECSGRFYSWDGSELPW